MKDRGREGTSPCLAAVYHPHTAGRTTGEGGRREGEGGGRRRKKEEEGGGREEEGEEEGEGGRRGGREKVRKEIQYSVIALLGAHVDLL